MANLDNLRKHLDELARRGAGYLRRYALKETIEKAMRHVHVVALVVPLVFAVLATADRFVAQELWVLNPLLTILLAIAVPIVYVLLAGALGFLARRVSRNYALALFDRELGLKDRLQAADEFLKDRGTNDLTEFERASIEDAMPFAEKAADTKLQDIKIATPIIHTGKWGHGVAAVVLLGIGMFASFFVIGSQVEGATSPEDQLTMSTVESPTALEEDIYEPPTNTRENIVSPPKNVAAEQSRESEVLETTATESQDSALRRANPSDSNPKQSVQMGLSAGASQDNKAGSAASNLSGQANPEKKKQDDTVKEAKEREAKESKSAIEEEQPKDESATGIAGGKGSGAGRQSSTAEMTENTSKVQQDDMDSDVDLESDDEEDEEQEAASAARPMINQRKAPVDRRLSPSGMVGQEEDDQQNGRGGAGGRKKTRGVAAMLLGVPQPDQLRSQINPGRVKIQRERAVPHPSEVDEVASESRGEMDESIGTVAQPELKPWMRNVVSNYFIAVREQPTEEGE